MALERKIILGKRKDGSEKSFEVPDVEYVKKMEERISTLEQNLSEHIANNFSHTRKAEDKEY